MRTRDIENCLQEYERNRHDLDLFLSQVHQFFSKHPRLIGPPPVVHSVRSRLKDPEHLREKLKRKAAKQPPITPRNLFKKVTDLAGVRVLHLHRTQLREIHAALQQKIEGGDWVQGERPMAFTWDPEATAFYRELGLRVVVRQTQYTSVHYLVRPRKGSPLCCEVQVRTLFEEAWGEIDHTINYPNATSSLACAEQLRVLTKIVGAATRLADAIFTSHAHEKLSAAKIAK